jgi:imidazole glycerol-phosphate synthase subunit HisH
VTTILVDYGSGNLRSAAKALERASRESGLGGPIRVSSRAEEVAEADRIVLPGVGAFADCRQGLNALPDMDEALREAVLRRARPFLGICVGMQLMADRGREFLVTEGLGWIPGEVVKLTPEDPALKIPHMGWNELRFRRAHPVLEGLAPGTHAYFVHSYGMRCAEPHDVIAESDYGGPIPAVVGRDNLVGTQFHPEKSQAAGLRLIANFLAWRP